jgi:hypothetical protein
MSSMKAHQLSVMEVSAAARRQHLRYNAITRRTRLAINELGETLARGLDLLVGEQARELRLQDEGLDSEIETTPLVKRGESACNLG